MKLSGVYIIGAGGFSKQVVDSFIHNKIQINGIFDDKCNESSQNIFYYKYPIIGKISDIKKYDKNINLFCGIGDNGVRKRIAQEYQEYNFINCIHPKSFISETVRLGRGNYIGPFSTLIADSVIGDFNLFNDMSLIGHDVTIGNYNHLCPHTSLGGFVKLGDSILVGTNATILPKIEVCSDTIIGAAALINKNITEKCTVVGNPYKVIKRHQ